MSPPPAAPGRRHARDGSGTAPARRPRLVLTTLTVGLVVLSLVAVGVGQVHASPGQVVDVLLRPGGAPGGAGSSSTLETVVWQLRAPRVLAGLCVGAVLACSGAALQAVVRNDLADPYLLGISSGACLGAALVIAGGAGGVVGAVVGAGSRAEGPTVTLGAFLGALAALTLVLVLVGPGRSLSGSRLVLAGLTVGYFLSAATNLVVVLSDSRDAVRAVTFWMLGSLGRSSWADVPALAAVTLGSVGALTLRGRSLDAVGLGDDVARSLGVDPDRQRRTTAVLAALGVAAATAVAGAIGFVGLVVPHLARRLVGATHRALIPTSALLGALVLTGADALARTVLAPREIPLGILTALVGTPLLMSMLRRRSHGS
ncbi:FecCD family ABC transporter permease [Actinomyces howellii]|uniref:FecCD family ABC transporter permease n=1 Tax=Actinomyces howellii TaxID=52771 RepID=UPI001F17657B|nr:iron ABC transporter permease [Actinomyces howellii]